MPATRSRASTEQAAEVAAEEVKQVQEEGSEIVAADVPATDVVKPVEPDQVVAEPAAVSATNGSVAPDVAAEAVPVETADTNSADAVATNGTVVSNGVAVEAAVPVVDESAAPVAEAAVTDASQKRKSEVGDGDVVPDSTDVKKQKVADGESVADEPVVDATA